MSAVVLDRRCRSTRIEVRPIGTLVWLFAPRPARAVGPSVRSMFSESTLDVIQTQLTRGLASVQHEEGDDGSSSSWRPRVFMGES